MLVSVAFTMSNNYKAAKRYPGGQAKTQPCVPPPITLPVLSVVDMVHLLTWDIIIVIMYNQYIALNKQYFERLT